MSSLATSRALAPARAVALSPRAVVALAFGASASLHALASLWHRTPAVFTDELVYTKLAQSVAAGEWLTLRGEAYVFPGVLPVLLQAPAWLLDDAGAAYAAIKVVHALVMALGAVGAYWLARAVVEPRRAAWAAVLTAAAPALLYHGYLMSEALAFPVFLFASGVVVRALARATPGWQAAAVAAVALACATRIQFAALGVAYALVVPAAGGLWRHRYALTGLALGALAGGGALGPYAGAGSLTYDPREVLGWAGWTAALLPFGVAWLLLPGALLGLAGGLARPRGAADRAFAALVAALVPLTLLQCGLVGAGQAFRPLERYAIYLAPLLAVAFLLWVERGAPWRRAHAALALALGASAWLLSLPALAPNTLGYAFSFDSPALSAYGAVAARLGHPDAASIFAAAAFLACAGVALAGRRRAFPGGAAVAAAVALLALVSAAAYSGDRAMTSAALASWSTPEPDWLERSGVARADYLALPGASPHYGWALETWNRNTGRTFVLGRERTEALGDGRLALGRDGALLLDGRPAPAGAYVVNEHAARLELAGAAVLARPRPELALVRMPAGARARGLVEGLGADGWSTGELRYRVWAPPGGSYRVRVELPNGRKARTVAAGPLRARLEPGTARTLVVPARGPLVLTVSAPDYAGLATSKPHWEGVRVTRLAYVAPDGRVASQAQPRCCR